MSSRFGNHDERKPTQLGAKELVGRVFVAQMRECFGGNRMINDGYFDSHASIIAE